MDRAGTLFDMASHAQYHAVHRGQAIKLCYAFRDRGRCRFGDACRYSHDLSLDTRTGTDPMGTGTGTTREEDTVVRQSEDKLRTWQRILDRRNLFKARRLEVERFFDLALELMDGDLGASQETIRKLATDTGLEFIKGVTDRNILDVVDIQSKVNLWRSQISPLFRLVTHPRAVDSNVLEQEVAKIHSFLLGVNANRADRLFGFVVDLANAWPYQTPDENPLTAVLELSLAVLFRLVDCNTTNMVNNSFHRLVGQFETLLASSDQASGNFSRLQATKYLEYLQRRLAVGKEMSDVKPHQAATVRAEEFVLRLDLPGGLSKDGARHDNDHADIGKIGIMPTYQEITTPRNEYLPTTDCSQWHLPGIRGRLDREFRLLREDTVGQLRDAVSDMLERLRNPGQQGHCQSKNSARTSTYADATIQKLSLNKDKGLKLTVRCRQPDMVRKMEGKERRLWWSQCKRLQPGALACVLDVAGMVQFFVVADSTLRGEKSSAMQVEQDTAARNVEHLTLSSDADYIYVHLHLVSNSQEDVSRVLCWYREVGSIPCRHLVEFPGVLLASFQYTLEALQQLSRKPDLPFTSHLAPQGLGDGSRITVSPPLFARTPGFKFNLQCITKDDQPFSIGLEEHHTAEEVSARTALDLTQSAALLGTLSREFSLIQGPPGTGKSYTGEKILKVLISSKEKLDLGPVVCVCYTNHALDQLLEHLLDDGVKNIIRMGSRSKSERLENLNIRAVSEKMPLTKTEKRQMYELGKRMRDLELEATGFLDQLSRCKSLSAIRTYLSMCYPAHCAQLFGDEEDDEGWQEVQYSRLDVIQRWLTAENTSVPAKPRAPRPIETLEYMDLAMMTIAERSKLHRFWLTDMRDTIIADLNRTLQEHNDTRDQRNRVRQEVRRRCLQQADIVGVTTTGLARELHLLRKLRAKVMLCEEAGEVLEAHILTAMLPSVEQAILIGDHLQLRPQIQNYQLQSTNPQGFQYSLDMSLFERLVQPSDPSHSRLPVTVLETQRRMHPSIAEMVRSTLYKTLKDAQNVTEYPEVVGMRRRLFWLHHEELETGAAALDPHSTSHSNDYEVEMTTCLVSHIVRQGKYGPEDIAVLTPYLGQLQKLKRRMAAELTFAVSLDDRDLDDLEELDTKQSEDLPPPKKQTVSKTTLARSVRLATVDNFQGEEAQVVIISLVRSNPQKRCGFLSTPNRINVLLSRAKHGCYIIGNSMTYSNVPMWNEVIQLLQANNNFGHKLELQCPRHPDTPLLVSQPEEFLQLSPDAGCNLRCDRRLECGHACHGPCHSDLVHKAVKCIEDCPRPKPGCDHACPFTCGDVCEEKCSVSLEGINLKLPCGHIVQTAKCWQAQNPAIIKCQEKVQRRVPGCDHTVTLPCFIDISSCSFQCQAECGQVLPCGHICRSICRLCNVREKGQVTETNHGICQQVCGRKYTNCPHSCEMSCHGEAKCGPCARPCEVRCSHSRCSKLCHEPCAPCAEQDCASSCPHGKCSMPCAAPCDWLPCSERCALVLGCGHQCPSLCGETCPDPRYCQTCGSEEIVSTVVDFLEMKEYKEVDVDRAPCIFPDCGHFFTVESMDGQMSMREHYELDENENPTGIKTAANPFSMDEVKACSVCRGSLRNIARYGRIVRRAMLDEATKKFISWSAVRHLELAERLMTEQQMLEKKVDEELDVGRPGRLSVSGNGSTQIKNINRWVSKKRYRGLLQNYIEISRFLDQVGVQEQPFHRVFEFVCHAKRQNKTGGAFDYDHDIIQLRGYLLALSLLLKCNITVLSDFASLWKAAGGTRQTKITVDLGANFAQCEKLLKLAADTNRPQIQVEGHIYFAQLCGFSLAFGPPDRPADESTPTALTQDTAASVTESCEAACKSLEEKGLEHLSRARILLEDAVWDSRALMEAEIAAAETTLNGGVFYRPVTTDEMRAVYAAMAGEFSGTGHWYTCEQGHPFTVGECGLPMEQARCPECRSAVGGQNHSPAEGVRHAEAIEELAMGVGRMRV